ncbi:MAG: Acyl-CoA thioesterase I precursor [Candidatus Omnitrophica bacterium ADurb.Bin205]|nr:MAG: Acyl-CoA thioesterase I precursor [Candidatus Omnitrophica bacterium ADurb.Bin205]
MPKINKPLIALLGFCVIAISACAKKEIQNIDSFGENIVCFGDSITFGYGVKPGEDYPSVLSKMVKMPVINAGVDGDTSISAFKRIDKDVLDKKPFLVLIEFCGNDFLKDIPRESTMNNVRAMILKAQGQGAITAIVDVSAGFFLRDYREKFARLAKDTGSIFVPAVLSGIITNPAMKSDFMHPNQEGYRIIAQRIYRAISPYLKSE